MQPRSFIIFATTSDEVELPRAVFTAIHTEDETVFGVGGGLETGDGVVTVELAGVTVGGTGCVGVGVGVGVCGVDFVLFTV